ncbi:MAG: IclR family transcriptional regulator [Burkholderiales bacterium]|nr:IclR family transcriptional regulator [Burkholderiales bacterium]
MLKRAHDMVAPAGKAPASKDRQFVTALARGLQILSCFSSETPELSGSELAKLTGLPQPTVWRLCHTMLQLGMLITTSGDKMRPGLPVLRLGHSALARLDVVELARPHMQEMANAYRAACGLATRQGLQMVMIERCHGDNPLLTNLRRGSAVPISFSGLGWCYLAGIPAQERHSVIAELEHDDTQAQRWKAVRKAFQTALAEYEERGFIVNSGVFHPDYHTVAVPVYDRHGKFHCGLNCGGPLSTLPPQKLRKEVAPRLLALARMLEAGMVLD